MRGAGHIPLVLFYLVGMLNVGCIQTELPGRSFTGTSPAMSNSDVNLRESLHGHVRVLAGDIGERNIWHYDALCRARDYISSQFGEAGYDVSLQTFNERSQAVSNVIAELPGVGCPSEILVIGAHYDTVRGSPGADDNATGVAAMIEIARALRAGPPMRRTVRFVAFVDEEEPFFWTEHMGSRVYAARSRSMREDIVGMISLEMLGFYRDERGSQTYPPPFNFYYPSQGNFVAWLSDPWSRRLLDAAGGSFRANACVPSIGLASMDFIVGHSDQWSFWVHGYPALMLTDTAMFRNPNYHAATDTSESIDYDRLTRVVTGMIDVTRELAESDERY